MDFEAFWHDLERRRENIGSSAACLVVLKRTPSSHQLARRLLREYSAEDAPIPAIDLVAWEQTEGHGREGRPWASPPAAGIYASLVRPLEPALVPRLPILVPVVLASVINDCLEDRCRVKWPNDLVAGSAKIGGILIDAVGHGGRHGVVISFGINTSADIGLFQQPGASSLWALGAKEMPLSRLAARLLTAIEQGLEQPGDDLIERYRRLSAHRPGDLVRWRHRRQVVEGRFVGFDEVGYLRLEVEGREQRVTAGDLLASEPDPPARETAADDR